MARYGDSVKQIVFAPFLRVSVSPHHRFRVIQALRLLTNNY